MIDTRRKLLTEALGEKWHDYHLGNNSVLSSCSCGLEGYAVRDICTKANRTFATTDDYEALREKVIKPNSELFSVFVWTKVDISMNQLKWWLTLSPEECNEIICNFGIVCLGWEVKE